MHIDSPGAGTASSLPGGACGARDCSVVDPIISLDDCSDSEASSGSDNTSDDSMSLSWSLSAGRDIVLKMKLHHNVRYIILCEIGGKYNAVWVHTFRLYFPSELTRCIGGAAYHLMSIRIREDAHPTSRHEILLRSYGWKGKDEQQELELRGDSNKAIRNT